MARFGTHSISGMTMARGFSDPISTKSCPLQASYLLPIVEYRPWNLKESGPPKGDETMRTPKLESGIAACESSPLWLSSRGAIEIEMEVTTFPIVGMI